MTATVNDIMQRAQQQQVEFISLQFTDIAGMLKNVTIPVAMLADCLERRVTSMTGQPRRSKARRG